MRRAKSDIPAAPIPSRYNPKDTFFSIRFRRILLVTWIAYAGYQLGRRPFSVSRAEIEREMHISKYASGNVDTSFLLMYTIGQLLYGTIVKNRWSNRAVLTYGLLGSAFACMVIANSHFPVLFIVAWGANGMFQAFGWAACMCLITPWLQPFERGMVMGFWGTNMAAGGIAGNALTSFFIGHLHSWRMAIFIDAIVLMSIVLFMYFYLGQHPNTFGLVSPLQLAENYDALVAVPDKVVTVDGEILPRANDDVNQIVETSERLSFLQTVRLPGVASISLSYFFHKLVRYSLIFWLPYYFTKELHFLPSTAGYIAATLDIGGVVGCIGSGWISDHIAHGTRRALCSVIFALGLALSLCCFVFLKLLLQISTLACCTVAFACGFFTFSVDSLMTGSLIQDYVDRAQIPQHLGAINGVVGGIGTAGSILQAYLTVAVSNQSWDTLFIVFSMLTLVAIALMWQLVWRELRSAPILRPSV